MMVPVACDAAHVDAVQSRREEAHEFKKAYKAVATLDD